MNSATFSEFLSDIQEISIEEYLKMFPTLDFHTLLDVREPWEVDIAHIKGSLSIPFSSLAEKVESLPEDQWIIIYCHHGVRSLRACHLLREKGFARVLSLRGGIHLWSQTIDPKIPTY